MGNRKGGVPMRIREGIDSVGNWLERETQDACWRGSFGVRERAEDQKKTQRTQFG